MVTTKKRKLSPSAFQPVNTTALSLVIQVRRSRRGWTQGQLAREMGVSQSAVARWETGSRSPRGELLLDLMEVLSFTRSDIV